MEMEDMVYMRDYFCRYKPESSLCAFYELAVEKEAVVELDTMWRMWLGGEYYSANCVYELIGILEGCVNLPKYSHK